MLRQVLEVARSDGVVRELRWHSRGRRILVNLHALVELDVRVLPLLPFERRRDRGNRVRVRDNAPAVLVALQVRVHELGQLAGRNARPAERVEVFGREGGRGRRGVVQPQDLGVGERCVGAPERVTLKGSSLLVSRSTMSRLWGD